MTRCLDCRKLIYQASRCAKCAAARKAAAQAPYAGSGWAWQKMRKLVLERDGGCVLASSECKGPLRVDHIVPASAGGTAVPENLRALCLHHHRAQPTTRGGG